MTIFLLWVIGAALVGFFASGTTLGFWSGFLFSVLLSPVIGFIIVLFYPSRETAAKQKSILAMQEQQLRHGSKQSTADELHKLSALKEKGSITEEEFNTAKQKLLAQV